ncbi:MAG TPA: AbrB/MazE/SpoVT family DNA-binding domain-containing protein [Rhizobiaceae bacterium]
MSELVTDVKMAANGRLVLPQAVRRAIGVEGETRLVVTVEAGELRLSPMANGVARAQALYRKHAKVKRSSQDFLADRERD